MGPRTLSSTWKQFDKLARAYHQSPEKKADSWEAMAELSGKANASRITDALAALLVQTYQGMEEVGVAFDVGEDHAPPEWATQFSPEESVIRINPVGVIRFYLDCKEAVERLKTPEARRDFQTYRFHAYMAELRKLPTRQVLFLLLLREVARARRITQVEKKGGGMEEVEDEAYMRVLWAFKELENFMREMKGVSIRSELKILWYESDWIVGKK